MIERWSSVKEEVGSTISGAGWALALTCPGPVAAQIGAGNASGLLTGVGMLGGIALAG